MNEIRDYLNKPATMRLYSEGMQLFQKYALFLPQFSMHWSTLMVGPRGNNKQVLEDCLNQVSKLAPSAPIQPTEVITKQPASNLVVKTNHEIDRLLEIRRLRQELAKASQRFHDYDTDADRALICDLIDRITEEIREKDSQLAQLQKFGKLPVKEPVEAHKPLPETYEELMAERTRTNNNRLKVEKRIEHLQSLPPNSLKRRDLPAKELQLHALVSRHIAIQKRIEKIRNERKNEDAGGNTST